jgi:hypothetical protein
MPNPHSLDTSIQDLLKAGGASEAAVQHLTPKASQLNKEQLLDLWLRQDRHSQGKLGQAAGQLKKAPDLSTEDVNSILVAFENAYNSSAGVGAAVGAPQGFFCNWSCCCCTPCCCCAVAVAEPAKAVA